MENKTIKARCELVENNGNKELFLYGPVINGKSWFADEDDYICPQTVKNSLKECKGEDLTIRLNTNGGDVFAGISIYNILKDYSGNITIKIDGIAASAGSIIAMGGDTIQMGVGSMMMIHNPWTFIGGNADELRKVADNLDKIADSITDIYMTRFVGEQDELTKLLDEETYLTSSESIALGLADEEIKEEQNKEDVKNSIIAKYVAKLKEPENSENKQVENQEGSFFMKKFK